MAFGSDYSEIHHDVMRLLLLLMYCLCGHELLSRSNWDRSVTCMGLVQTLGMMYVRWPALLLPVLLNDGIDVEILRTKHCRVE